MSNDNTSNDNIKSKEDMAREYCKTVKDDSHVDYNNCFYFNGTIDGTLAERANKNYGLDDGTLFIDENLNILGPKCLQYGDATTDDNNVPSRLATVLATLRGCSNIYKKDDEKGWTVRDSKGSCDDAQKKGILKKVGHWEYDGCDGAGGVKVACKPEDSWCDDTEEKEEYDKAYKEHSDDCKNVKEETFVDDGSIFKKWWFWTIIVTLIVGGVIIWKFDYIKGLVQKTGGKDTQQTQLTPPYIYSPPGYSEKLQDQSLKEPLLSKESPHELLSASPSPESRSSIQYQKLPTTSPTQTLEQMLSYPEAIIGPKTGSKPRSKSGSKPRSKLGSKSGSKPRSKSRSK